MSIPIGDVETPYVVANGGTVLEKFFKKIIFIYPPYLSTSVLILS